MVEFGLDRSLDVVQCNDEEMEEMLGQEVPLLYRGKLPKGFKKLFDLPKGHPPVSCVVVRLAIGDFLFVHCDDGQFYGFPVYEEPTEDIDV